MMSNSELETILGDDINFRGKLEFKKNLQINGKFKGKITTGGNLIVGTNANVEADIETGSISIYGNLRGNVKAARKIELYKNARLIGDLKTQDLYVENGSRFNGSCIME